MSDEPEVTGRTYGVELLFDHDYDLRAPELHAALRASLPNADVETGAGPIAIFHQDVPIELQDRTICAQTVILGTDAAVAPDELEGALLQTRDWTEARVSVARARRRLLVTDLMSSMLTAPLRLETFQRALAAITSAMRPIAISWMPANKLVEPAAFLAAMADRNPSGRFVAAMNVRLYNVGDSPGDIVMDTMGLASLGLPDLQLHFRGLNPDDVAHYLYNSAYYIFEKGDVIADGHTIEGIPPGTGTKWRCQHEASLIRPRRGVLDLDPGPPLAAGDRAR